MASPLPVFSAPLLTPAHRAPALNAPGKHLTTTVQRPSAAPAPSLSAAPSPAACGSLHPIAVSLPSLRPPDMSSYTFDFPSSALHPSAATATAPRASRPLRNQGAVLAPPPPASVSGLVSSLYVVFLPPEEGEAHSASQHGAVSRGKSMIALNDQNSHRSLCCAPIGMKGIKDCL